MHYQKCPNCDCMVFRRQMREAVKIAVNKVSIEDLLVDDIPCDDPFYECAHCGRVLKDEELGA